MSLLALLVQKFAIVDYVPVHGSLSLEHVRSVESNVNARNQDLGSLFVVIPPFPSHRLNHTKQPLRKLVMPFPMEKNFS
jgi:hypothetical protein